MSPFPQNVIDAAVASQKKWNIFASVSLAQWACESAYGKAMSGVNNPFGIKATKAQIAAGDATMKWTHETLNGQYVKVQQYFANYSSVEGAFDAHAQLLATSKYYVKSRHDNNPEQFAIDLTGIYATGIPGHPYGLVLVGIMDQYNLYQYDTTPGLSPTPPLKAPLAETRPTVRPAVVAIPAAASVVPAVAHASTGHFSLAAFALLAGVAVALVVGIIAYLKRPEPASTTALVADHSAVTGLVASLPPPSTAVATPAVAAAPVAVTPAAPAKE